MAVSHRLTTDMLERQSAMTQSPVGGKTRPNDWGYFVMRNMLDQSRTSHCQRGGHDPAKPTGVLSSLQATPAVLLPLLNCAGSSDGAIVEAYDCF